MRTRAGRGRRLSVEKSPPPPCSTASVQVAAPSRVVPWPGQAMRIRKDQPSGLGRGGRAPTAPDRGGRSPARLPGQRQSAANADRQASSPRARKPGWAGPGPSGGSAEVRVCGQPRGPHLWPFLPPGEPLQSWRSGKREGSPSDPFQRLGAATRLAAHPRLRRLKNPGLAGHRRGCRTLHGFLG